MEEWAHLVTRDIVGIIDAMMLIVAALGRTEIVIGKIEVLSLNSITSPSQ
jgi:hypothetical protein